MITDAVTITISVVIAAFGALAGYFGRIAQKIEDRRDEIYINELPALSSLLRSFITAFEIYRETKSFEQLATDIAEVRNGVKNKVFSGNLILFDKVLFAQLLEFYQITERMNSILDGIQKNTDDKKKEAQIDIFSRKFSEGKDFLYEKISINVSSTVKDVKKIEDAINNKFDKYLPFSWKLVILITIIGVLLGIIEIFNLFLK
jgi:hypothetical protein